TQTAACASALLGARARRSVGDHRVVHDRDVRRIHAGCAHTRLLQDRSTLDDHGFRGARRRALSVPRQETSGCRESDARNVERWAVRRDRDGLGGRDVVVRLQSASGIMSEPQTALEQSASGPWTDLGLTLPIFITYHLGVVFLPTRNAADWATVELIDLANNDLTLYG